MRNTISKANTLVECHPKKSDPKHNNVLKKLEDLNFTNLCRKKVSKTSSYRYMKVVYHNFQESRFSVISYIL